MLLRVKNRHARNFYEIEAIGNAWSARQLERQIAALLFERLAKSRDREGVTALANQGLQPVHPVDVIKDPYILIDMNVKKLGRGDLGQMQLYVNFYNREIAAPEDNPTIGIILCTDKNDAMVRYLLPEKDPKIFTGRYQFHLPSEEQLRNEIQKELDRLPPKEDVL